MGRIATDLTSKKEFRNFILQNCYYCGCNPETVHRCERTNGDFIHNGIDRMNNNIGYIIDNCVTCCSHCNKAKLNRDKEEYEKWVLKSAKYIKNRQITSIV